METPGPFRFDVTHDGLGIAVDWALVEYEPDPEDRYADTRPPDVRWTPVGIHITSDYEPITAGLLRRLPLGRLIDQTREQLHEHPQVKAWADERYEEYHRWLEDTFGPVRMGGR